MRAASRDDRVLAIKQTRIAVSGDSPIVHALIEAARAGKQVTVMLELRARFDEAANIKWARQLDEAGAHVIYGLKGLKVHAKLLMIVRRDEDGIRRYCHLGTGNYNDKTARIYTDISFFTANAAVGKDVASLFNVITGFCVLQTFSRIVAAPTTMRSTSVERIRREKEIAESGRLARIVAKFNSLVDEKMCQELYEASQAGVEIDLIVRGICILKPGVAGLSENIRVRSVIGRFLEHSRIFCFGNDGQTEIAIAYGVRMSRNLPSIEHLVWITDSGLQDESLSIIDRYLADTLAISLRADGDYGSWRPPLDDGLNFRPTSSPCSASWQIRASGRAHLRHRLCRCPAMCTASSADAHQVVGERVRISCWLEDAG